MSRLTSPTSILFTLTLIFVYESVTGEQRRITNLLNPHPRVQRSPDEQEVKVEIANKSSPSTKKERPSLTIKYEKFALPKGYDKFQIPRLGYGLAFANQETDPITSADVEMFSAFGDAHMIEVTLRIKNIDDVDETEEEFIFAGDLILSWTDHVLARTAMVRFGVNSEEFDPKQTEQFFRTLNPDFLNHLWKPDIFIEDLVQAKHPHIMGDSVTLRINEATGEVVVLSRLRIRMKCEMDFHYYPADTQTCKVVIRSGSYSHKEILLRWDELTLDDCGGANYDFQLTTPFHDVLNERLHGNKRRRFNVLRFNVLARRKLSYHMVQTFLPSVFFIIITWLCFLIPATMVEARIGVAMTTLLTLTAMFASVRESTPIVSYVRYIDIWMAMCILFVFLTLLEFTVLHWLWSKEPSDENDDGQLKTKSGAEEGVEFEPIRKKSSVPNPNSRKLRAAKFIEAHAFWIFSILFLFFVVAFWTTLLIGSDYFVWDVDEEINCVDNCKYATDGCGGKPYPHLGLFDKSEEEGEVTN